MRGSQWLTAGLLACVPAAMPTGAGAAPNEALLTVQVLAKGVPDKERRVGPVQPFYRQDLLTESGIILRLPPDALKAFRTEHDFEDNDPVILMEWLQLDDTQPTRHLGYLHCARGGTYGTGPVKVCLRDTDGDGRIDALADVHARNMPASGLSFVPIAPIAYDYVRQDRAPLPWSMYVQPGVGLAYRVDKATGKLLFRAQILAAAIREDVEPFVEVDPTRLPTTVEIAGAKVSVLAWDGKRPTIRIDQPLTDRPLRVIAAGGPGLPSLHGSKKWRLEIIEAPLPGAPQ